MPLPQNARVQLRAQNLVLPNLLRRVLAQVEQPRAFSVTGRNKHLVPGNNRVRRVHSILRHPPHAPRFLPGLRIDRQIRLRRSNHDQRPCHVCPSLQRHRRRITRMLRRGFPHDPPALLLHRHASLAHIQDEQLLMHVGRARVSPVWNRKIGLLLDVLFPNDFSARPIKTKQVAPSTQPIQPSAIDRRCSGGPALEKFVAQLRLVTVLPNLFPARRVETINCILPRPVAGGVSPPIRHHKTGVTQARPSPPRDLRPFIRPLERPTAFQ
jgi:hypothetical protein